jgi:hypothetical protein
LNYFDGEYYHFNFGNDSRIYYFDYQSKSINSGFAVMCRIRKISANQKYISSVLCDNLSIFNKNFEFLSYSLNAISQVNNRIENFIINDSYFEIIKTVPKGKLLTKNNFGENIFIDPNSISPLSEYRPRSESIKYGNSISDRVYLKNNLLLYDPITWDVSKSMTIEFKYSLGTFLNAFQPTFSHIIGNHPGNGFDGFIFQKKHLSQNEYVFSYGNGSRWIDLKTFIIEDTNVHSLKLVISNDGVKLFNDGLMVGESSSIYSNSNLPIQIGGLSPGIRFYNGYVFDLKINY